MNCSILSRMLTPENNLYVASQTFTWHFKDSSSISSTELNEEMEQWGGKESHSLSFLMRIFRILLSISLARCHAESWKRELLYKNVIFLHWKPKKQLGFLRPLRKEQLTLMFIVARAKFSMSWIKQISLGHCLSGAVKYIPCHYCRGSAILPTNFQVSRIRSEKQLGAFS